MTGPTPMDLENMRSLVLSVLGNGADRRAWPAVTLTSKRRIRCPISSSTAAPVPVNGPVSRSSAGTATINLVRKECY